MSIQIGELAKRTACPIQTIRYYEREGLLPSPDRSSGNFRLYGERHIERLQFILHCRSLDMPLDDVRVLLRYREQPAEDCGGVNTLLDKHIHEVERRIEALAVLKHHLCALRETCSAGRAAEACGILQGLSEAGCACDADAPHQG
ncbi:Cd(II)/Pb(II)-responsive transcriptional regulator [Ralstonia pickettii]|jgi:Cd(II)/Pb(II)-responsive transcriptional regulator|uniref:Transcriptional regulator, MerR family n=2 Tax=Pseudomonadota TaxID=1224 RepID=B2UF21_RALPJ|nr:MULTISPECIES: Cd(II)/Pb(II)-responsive transcriptional regulator [Ralstonia]NOZ17310.1 Cd(II)/Pb(II)-responsive transcriptional regulator [Betaproteobacteria bacterium]MBA9885193.1 Cd(II)/Pb(II)-responsive transcriptional regulator [Ralstonia pickettii]MBA9890069.1 Cd(II)/Pb(II)-responsive transcriptional regulator [Ralstonia pickettii]MBA9894972.1 Cd(II)/Pb(II)-responsive transcriptional regulator [Ralstonia pickettii]MBA9926983.1 Cd(II)/Pb(II)-responsive transcriptional regulator [Ralston